MLINSYEFLWFFGGVFCLYWLLPWRSQNILLLLASYYFYGLWHPQFLLLIAISTALDYCCGLWLSHRTLESRQNRQILLYLGIVAGVALGLNWEALPGFGKPGPVDWTALFSLSWGDSLAIAAIVAGGAMVLRLPKILAAYPNLDQRRYFLGLSVITNLSILGFFKYFNFFADNLEALLRQVGLPVESLNLPLLLPIGVSFYTFKTLSYTIDLYRNKITAEPQLLHYGLFLSFFPSLLAGPIDRAASLLGQIGQQRSLTWASVGRGLFLILFGLFKKIAISDGVAKAVNAVYQTTMPVSGLEVVVATVLYAIQIYGDFSGYTDMARGVAKLLGFNLVLNFNLPYVSQNPSEFWRRWHISLSTWLRDYLYISLGGNRVAPWRNYVNLMITMVLGGLWHGATWNFVLWGAYQGAVLCVYRWLDPRAEIRQGWAGLWRSLLFFGVTCYGWLLFGVSSWPRIRELSWALVSGWGRWSLALPPPPLSALLGIVVLGIYELIEHRQGQEKTYQAWIPALQGLFYALLIFIVLMGSSNAPAQFIYTQF